MSNTSTPHFAAVNSTHTAKETNDSRCPQAVATRLSSHCSEVHTDLMRATHLLPFITACEPGGEGSCVYCIRTIAPLTELKITLLPLLLTFPCDLQFTVRSVYVITSLQRDLCSGWTHFKHRGRGERTPAFVFLRSRFPPGKFRLCNQIRTWSLPSTSFPSLTVLPFDAIYSDNRRRPYMSTVWFYSHLLDLGRFFSFLILFTIFRTPLTVDQPVARPLPTH
jgi:hypothetical protein